MKLKRWLSCITGTLLAFAISLGAAGSMITGFDLNIVSISGIVLTCAVAAAVSALLFRLKYGGTILLCLLALSAGYLWHSSEPAQQVLALLFQISKRYDNAYGWGVIRLMDGDLAAYTVQWPMAIVGTLVAITVSFSVCRAKSAIPACIAGLLPLCFCMVVTDTVPAAGYLYILLLGIIILVLTSIVRQGDAHQGDRLTAMAAIPAAIALGALFLAVPRESYVNRSKEAQEELATLVERIPEYVDRLPELAENAAEQMTQNFTGSTPEEVDLENLGARITSPFAVMDVTVRSSGTLYLRGQDYDVYSGTGWIASDRRTEQFSGIGEVTGDVIISTRRRQEVRYLPYYPGGEITLVGGRAENSEGARDYVLNRVTLPSNWRQTVRDYYNGGGDVLAAGSADYAADPSGQLRYLNLPIETEAAAKEIVNSILNGEVSATARAETIASYVRGTAVYDLNTGRMPSGEADFALWFLEDAETGYCVHFATATVVLLRAAGVEARYVTGYMVQTVAGQTATVTGENAHAWAEYFEPALGVWIPLESTPPDLNAEATEPADEPSEDATEPHTPQNTEETAEPGETEAPSQTPDATGAAGETDPSGSGALGEPEPYEAPKWPGNLALAILIPLLAAFFAELQRQSRLRLRRQSQRRGKPNSRALACWRELVVLSRLLHEPASREAEELAQKAKFSQHILTAEELAVFGEHLRHNRRRLKEEVWYKQLIYRYVFALY